MILISNLTLAAALLVAPVQAAPVPAQHSAASALDPQRLAIARELIDIVLPPAQRQQMMEGVLNSMVTNMIAGFERGSGFDKKLAEKPRIKIVFDRFVERQRQFGIADLNAALPDLIEAYAHAYARNFSLDELTQIRAFMTTPAGAKFMQRAPSLLADPDVTAWMRKLTEQGAARQPEEMRKFGEELKAAEAKDGDSAH